jgi:outer membrane cobalamin receptor
VELIKGAASSLYGGQALGGVINLISKVPNDRNELLLNRRTMGVTDAASWMSRRFSDEAGISLLVSGTVQQAADPDDDGWGDQPRANRWAVRPRYAFSDASGRSLFLTAGYGYDDRQGGTLGGAVAPDGSPFRERLTGRRADAGLTLRLPRADSGHVGARLAFSTNMRRRQFGSASAPAVADQPLTGFAEVTRVTKSERGALVLGAAMQADMYANEGNGAFDHEWVTPALFVTADRDVGPVTVSASVRGDNHPATGLELTERLAFLVKPAEGWSARLSGGNGFAAPTPLTEEVEAIGLRLIQPGALRGERSVGAMLDVSGHALGAEVLLTGYASSIRDAIQLVDVGDAQRSGVLRNASGATRVGGIEGAAIWRFAENKFLLTYGYARGTQTDAESGVREPMPLLNRHRVGADVMLEKPGVYRVGIEGIYYGRQALDDNPYLGESKPYVYTMALAMRQLGPVELVANFENLLDVRMTRYQRLVRPSPTTGGRWTTDVWAPLEGFMANVAVRYRWTRATGEAAGR